LAIEKWVPIELWKKALLQPVETFHLQRMKADLTVGAKYMAIAGVVTAVITGIVALIASGAAGIVRGPLAALFATGVSVISFIGALIAVPIIFVLVWLVSSAVLYVIAKLLNGKGSFTEQSYLIALYSAPLNIISAILVMIPVLGPILSVLLSLWGLWLLTLALKATHRYSTGRAVATWLLPIVVLFVLALLLAAAFAATILALILGTRPI
jgi:hypothetical protein